MASSALAYAPDEAEEFLSEEQRRRWQNADQDANQDPLFWEEMYRNIIAGVKLRFDQAGEPEELATATGAFRRLMLSTHVVELQSRVRVNEFIQSTNRMLSSTSLEPWQRSEVKERLEVLRKIIGAISGGRRGLVEIQATHHRLDHDYPIQPFEEDGFEADPSKMELGVPYLFEFGGATHAAVKKADQEIDFFLVP